MKQPENFAGYSKYYDLLYEDKDYRKETKFIVGQIKKYLPAAKKILALGCGTCNHEVLFAKAGYQVKGVDRSSSMLMEAKQKITNLKLENWLTVENQDITDLKLKTKYHAATALFNVIGYQVTNQDISSTLKSVSNSLVKGGLFIFDCWYGPAVLKSPPTDRVRQFTKGKNRLIRLTRSNLRQEENLIEINFNVLSLIGSQLVDETYETHLMRYWTLPELEGLLATNGLRLLKAGKFLNVSVPPSEQFWDFMVIAQKI